MQLKETPILGITRDDIQQIFEKALKDFKQSKTRIIFLDASYLYSFDSYAFEEVKKFNLLGRYYSLKVKQLEKEKKTETKEYELALLDNKKYYYEWHKCLETWVDDRDVILGDTKVKPLQIQRSFDRVVNEGLEGIAQQVLGQEESGGGFPYRALDKGNVTEIGPNATILLDEADRINVNENPDGGSLSRDGSTIYSVGNHNKGMESATIKGVAMLSTDSPTTDRMFDYSAFPTPITHIQNVTAVGSTTIIYMCSS